VRRALAPALVVVALVARAGGGEPGPAVTPPAAGDPVSVVTTSTDLRALVDVVGGARVRVESLTRPADDPHALDVRPGQLERLKTADLLVTVGLDHEPWLPRALRSAGNARLVPGSQHYLDASRAVALLQTDVPRVKSERGVHVHGFGNPHYWLDPENARPITQAVLEALARLSPGGRAALEANRQRFLERLDAGLARWSRAMAPHRGARVVVVHETWPYLARRFGLVVVAAAEPAPGVPPAPAALAALSGRMRESGVRLLLAEPSSNAALVARLAARSGARAVTLVPSVGADPEATDYLALFDVNVERLTRALSAAR
jgi:ABC-type Zn uptake system ZnuABC Zn-binding protein ZnuA